eukprot:GHVO01040127.1.p1 GENE.GHVO01040127.1~~GHVO01040127.1.p1  ORF type:complete len:126 (+),score=11.97 GHVO01040127.1:76-453(+)
MRNRILQCALFFIICATSKAQLLLDHEQLQNNLVDKLAAAAKYGSNVVVKAPSLGYGSAVPNSLGSEFAKKLAYYGGVFLGSHDYSIVPKVPIREEPLERLNVESVSVDSERRVKREFPSRFRGV